MQPTQPARLDSIFLRDMNNNQRTIHLTEVSVTDFPAANDYKYKCRVQVISDKGQPLLQKDLFARMQPSWLLDVKNKGECIIAISLCYREGDITHPWQDAGTVNECYAQLSEWTQRRVGISDYHMESSSPAKAKNSPDAQYE